MQSLSLAVKGKEERGKLMSRTEREEKPGKRVKASDKDSGVRKSTGKKGRKIKNKKNYASLNVSNSSKHEDL